MIMLYCKEKKGKIKKGGYKGGRGYSGYHTTFDHKKVFLRSLLEYNFALFLDKTFQPYKTESMCYVIKEKTYKPDFFLYNHDYTKLLKIIDIKGTKNEANNLLNSCKNHFNSLGIDYDVYYNFVNYKSYMSKEERNKWINNYVKKYPEFDFRGIKNPMYGVLHSKSTKKKIGDKTREYMKIPEIKEKHKVSRSNFWKSESGIKLKKKYRKLRHEKSIEFHKSKDISDPKIFKNCTNCNTSFKCRTSSKKKYCSSRCSFQHIAIKVKNGDITIRRDPKKQYGNRILSELYGKLKLEELNVENFEAKIKELKAKNKISNCLGISIRTIVKYFDSFDNFKNKLLLWES